MSDSSSLLQVVGVNKSFVGVHALKNFTFDVAQGEVHALVGENGAGKSTFVKILSGDTLPDSGTIIFDGIDLSHFGGVLANYNTQAARSLGITMVYQEPSLVPELSVMENIYLGSYSYNKVFRSQINWSETRRRAEKLVEQFGLELDVRAKVKDLGTGQHQLVEILRAVSKRVKLLLLDEPTSALSAEQVQILFRIVKKMIARRISVIYISHRLEEVFEIADRVTVLRDGEKIATRHLSDIDEDEIIQMMVGRKIEEHYVKHTVPIGEPILRVEGLRAEPLVAQCSFSVRKGEILGIAGLVGAGRTEMAKTIIGLYRKTSGRILVEGQEKRIDSPFDALRAGIAYLAENRTESLIYALDIAKNITLARLREVYAAGLVLNKKKEIGLAVDFMKRMQIEASSVRQRVKELSGGNQQKVAIARWIYSNAKVFILDEPTRGIDVGAKVEVYNLMYQLLLEGKAIVLVSSELPEIVRLSDRVIVVYKARTVAEFTGSEISQENIMRSATGQEAGDGRNISIN